MNIDRLKNCVQAAHDLRYFTMKALDVQMECDDEIESRWGEKQGVGLPGVNEYIYYFKENFFKSKGMSPFGVSILEYKDDAVKYLNDSFPFCFNIRIEQDPLWIGYYRPQEDENPRNYMMHLAFYTMCLGADEEQTRLLPKILKNQKMTNLKKSGKIERSNSTTTQGTVNLDDVQASSVDSYQANDLLSVLDKINDKNVSRIYRVYNEKWWTYRSELSF